MTDCGVYVAGPTNDVGLSAQTCPRCASRLIRMARHPLDRLFSFIVPVHRYRCPGFACRWEGCLRVADPSELRAPRELPAADTRASRTSLEPPSEPSATWDAAVSEWVEPPAVAPCATPARL